MCSPARCAGSGKITWAERGMHVDSLMGGTQPAQRGDDPDPWTVRTVGACQGRVW